MKRTIVTSLLVASVLALFIPASLAPGGGRSVGVEPEHPSAIQIELEAAPPPADLSRGDAATGLIMALLEEELSHLRGVVPVVKGSKPSPGLAEARYPDAGPAVWRGKLALEGAPELERVTFVLCDPAGQCGEHEIVGGWQGIEPDIQALIASVSERMGRPSLGDHHVEQVSADEYATLMLGRAAAIIYDMLEPVQPPLLGSVRVDPLARAPYLDPGMELAWWQQGRSATGEARQEAFARAVELAPGCPLHLADDAWALEAAGQCDAAWERWQEVAALAEEDPRFWIPRARTAICAEQLDEAERLLAGIAQPRHPEVARLQVELSTARGELPDHDARLAFWQESAPRNPEPVRQRIALRLRDGRYAEVQEFLPVLRERGADREAEQLRLALAAQAEDWGQAAQSAGRLGLIEAERIQARAALERGEALSARSSSDPLMEVAIARRDLETSGARRAMQRMDALLIENPNFTPALEVRLQAEEALGHREAALRTRQQLRWIDPYHWAI